MAATVTILFVFTLVGGFLLYDVIRDPIDKRQKHFFDDPINITKMSYPIGGRSSIREGNHLTGI